MKVKLSSIFFFLMFTVSIVAQKNQKPNIIIVLADDISAREMPLYGSDTWSPPKDGNTQDLKYRAKTPVLDKLAKGGVYAKTAWASVVCSPSRAMMMTGRYAHLHKWWGNKTTGKQTNKEGRIETLPLYKSSPNSLGHVAKMAGYATMWSGKTQMRNKRLELFGFDEGVFTPGESSLDNNNPYTDFRVQTQKVNGKKLQRNNNSGELTSTYDQSGWYFKPHVMLMNHPSSKKQFEWWPNTKESKKEYSVNTYGPDVELKFIFDFIERKTEENKPFFVYHTSHLGHDGFDFINPDSKSKWPGTPKIEWKRGKYKRTEPNITGSKGNFNTNGTVTEPGIHSHLNYLDYQMSLYLKKLKDLKIDKNTIIIFCADNGTSGYGKNSSESQKGTHVPFIVYAPGLNLTKKGEQDILLNLADVLPTVADIGGVKLPENYKINGESLWSFLTTDKKEHRKWIYGYKDGQQIIRSKNVLKDGANKWYDVSETPTDLISYPIINNWDNVSKNLIEEKEALLKILPEFNTFKSDRHGELSEKHKKQIILQEKKKIELIKKNKEKKNKLKKWKKSKKKKKQ